MCAHVTMYVCDVCICMGTCMYVYVVDEGSINSSIFVSTGTLGIGHPTSGVPSSGGQMGLPSRNPRGHSFQIVSIPTSLSQHPFKPRSSRVVFRAWS